MSESRAERIQSLRRRAAALPPEAREAFLDAECAGDDALRRQVASDTAVAETLAYESDPHGNSRARGGPGLRAPGSGIERYTLLEHLGAGGFGEVWLAEQREPVRRRVAIKLIRPGMDSQAVLARFEAERQALALMDHPNIARVLDAGLTGTGQPYFAMELARGVPMTDYCDGSSLTLRRRIELFLPLCHAVQHAHQKGVVHRDLKPGNVLVTLRDGEPVPKIIDFGIAKALHQPLAERTFVTQVGEVMGTPEYMSPEQAEGSGLDVDTRSDIYSLGVLLYELLTGKLPFDAERLRARSMMEFQRIIREEEPPRPSTRWTHRGDTQASKAPETRPDPGAAQPAAVARPSIDELARRRATDPAVLRREMRGDLDWIVLKAIAKDRQRRYDTAIAFAQDLERHLRNEPVSAGPPSAGYRLSKFVRRHRAGVAGGVVAALMLILGLVTTTWQMMVARDARQVALDEAAKSRRIVRFHAEVIEGIDPFGTAVTGPTSEVSVADLLDRAVERAGAAFVDAPELEVEVRRTLGAGYFGINDAQAGLDQLRRAHDVALRRLGRADPRTLAAVRALTSRLVIIPQEKNQTEALALLPGAIDISRRVLGPESEETIETLAILGVANLNMRRFDEAAAHLTEALDLATRVLPRNHRLRIAAETDLARTRERQGNWAEAEALARSAAAAAPRSETARPADVAEALRTLARILRGQRRWTEAAEQFRLALDADVRLFGADHSVANIDRRDYGICLALLGRAAEAEALLTEAIDRQRTRLGPENRSVMETASALAWVANLTGDLPRGERIAREAVAAYKPESTSGRAAHAAVALAYALDEQGHGPEAEAALLPYLDYVQGLLVAADRGRPEIRALSPLLGRFFLSANRPNEAELCLLFAYECSQSDLGPTAPRTQRIAADLVALYEKLGRKSEAIEWRARAGIAPSP